MTGSPNIRPIHKGRNNGTCLLGWSICIPAICLATLISARPLPANAGDQHPFKLAFSASMFAEVNESDARAAIKVWIMTVAKNMDIPVDPDPHIQHSVETLVAFGKNNAVSGFGLTTPEIPHLSREIKLDRFAVGVRKGQITEEYLLLVRKDSGIERIDQLRQCSINILSSPRMSLAPIWLDTLLLEAQKGRTSDFFGRVTRSNKSAKVVLPVFFGKTDACLISRANFNLMGELNPQLNKQLKVLAASPGLVPTGFAFIATPNYPISDKIMKSMEHLGDTPAGRQILALTQSDRIETRPLSCLDRSLELVSQYKRLSKIIPTDRMNNISDKKSGGTR